MQSLLPLDQGRQAFFALLNCYAILDLQDGQHGLANRD